MKISAMLLKLGKKSSNSGVIIPTKMRFCNECSDKRMCDKCNIQINENKEREANLYLLKRKTPNQIGQILPYYRI